ncbi:MAG: tetratricopeptide repeat protein [Planctomycetes bacterium]|nr:tetratricopeptide repeat protein [Planctomycetota bacterium]
MFEQDKSPEAVLARPLPPRFRLAAALLRRIGSVMDSGARGSTRISPLPAAKRDEERARRLVSGFEGRLDDSSNTEELDDAIERGVDALLADNHNVEALLLVARALVLHGHIEDWLYHPRPLKEARRLLQLARELSPENPVALEWMLRCELLLRRFESASFMLDEMKATGKLPYAHALGRAIFFDLQDKFKLAEQSYAEAVLLAANDEARSWALVYQARAAANLGDLARADGLMAKGVMLGRPHRQRLHLWSNLKFHRKRYEEAWELNRRALSFGEYEEAMWARQYLLTYFRRLGFTPKPPAALPEEMDAKIDGPKAFSGGKPVTGDVMGSDADGDEDFVPAARVNLFIEGEHLPVVSDIADPGASFEGRAKLTVRYVDPRTLEKQPLLTGARFRTGQYVFMDERAGTVYHALIVKRAEKRNPYRDLPEQDRQFFRLDDKAMARFDKAPWDVRLYIAEHGFDPLMGVLNFCKLVDSFVRHGGGIGVDVETGLAVQAGDWRNEGPQSFDVAKHVIVHVEETAPEVFWMHTHGLCKFLRPELEIYGIPGKLVEGAWARLMEAANEAATGALVREGELVGDSLQPLLVRRGRARPEEDSSHNLRPRVELADVSPLQEPLETGAAKGMEALIKGVAH